MAQYKGYIGCMNAINNVCVDCYNTPALNGNFDAYIPLLLQVEGGYQNNPNDPGNFNSLGQNVGTYKGISARFYEGIIGRPPMVADMKAITTQMATNLYEQYFWNPLRASEINSQAVANTIIDHHVNSGQGARLAQQVLNDHFGKNLSEDNKIGPQTLAAINSVSESAFVSKYNEARADFYATLNNSSTFLAGWLKRLESFAVEHKKKILGFNSIVIAALFFYLLTRLESDGSSEKKPKYA